MSDEEVVEQFLPGYDTVEAYSKSLLTSLVQATQASNKLPVDVDFNFYKSFSKFTKKSEVVKSKLLDHLDDVLSVNSVTNNRVQVNRDLDAVDQYDTVLEHIDQMLERVDIIIDQDIKKIQNTNLPMNGISQSTLTKFSAPTQASKKGNNKSVMMLAKNIIRPQIKFAEKIDNSNNAFVPKLKTKPNAIEPLSIELVDDKDPESSFKHPYRKELESLEWDSLNQVEVCMYKNLEDCEPAEWVDTLEALTNMANYLSTETEFAIDLEAHSYRSYSGLVCLMQISTRSRDFLVDTLVLRSHMHLLLESFTNPKILKVLHGADSDIVWLQRDFGLYVVNMFDTGQASRVLGFPRYSLAFLLQHYCNITADKKYQMADWRIRPIPDEMKHYATEDTHTLLYIYDNMRNELISRSNENGNLLQAVWQRSTDICLKTFEKGFWNDKSYQNLYLQYQRNFSKEKLSVFKALYDWRDEIARKEDESPRYVLPNHMIFQIAGSECFDASTLLAQCNPIPPLVRLHVHDLLLLITKSRKTIPEGIDNFFTAAPLYSSTTSSSSSYLDSSTSLFNPLIWVSDKDHSTGDLLAERLARSLPIQTKQASDILNVFGTNKKQFENLENLSLIKNILEGFIDPYTMYSTSSAENVAQHNDNSNNNGNNKNISNNNNTSNTSSSNNNNSNNNNSDSNSNNNSSNNTNSNIAGEKEEINPVESYTSYKFVDKEMRENITAKTGELGENVKMLSEMQNTRTKKRSKKNKNNNRKKAKIDSSEVQSFDYASADKFRDAPPTLEIDMRGKSYDATAKLDQTPRAKWEPRINLQPKSGSKAIDGTTGKKASSAKVNWPKQQKKKK